MVQDDCCQDVFVQAGVLHAFIRHVIDKQPDHPLPSFGLLKFSLLSIWNLLIDHPVNQHTLIELDEGKSISALACLLLTETSSLPVEIKQALLDLLIFLSTCSLVAETSRLSVIDRIIRTGVIVPLVGMLLDPDQSTQLKTTQLLTLLAGSESGANVIRIEGGIPLLGLVLSTRGIAQRVAACEALIVLARDRECQVVMLDHCKMAGTIVNVLRDLPSGATLEDTEGVLVDVEELGCSLCRLIIRLIDQSSTNNDKDVAERYQVNERLFIEESVVEVLVSLQEKYSSSYNSVKILQLITTVLNHFNS
jgi:hypothetical protein